MEEISEIEQLKDEINELKEEKNKDRKLLRNTIIGVVILGALGSGFWEKILSPISRVVFLYTSNGMSSITNKFMDALYREVSVGFHEKYSLLLYGASIGIVVTIYVLLWKDMRHAKKKYKEIIVNKNNIKGKIESNNIDNKVLLSIKIEKASKKIFFREILVYSLMIGATLWGLVNVGKEDFINQAITTTLNNIEIVSPYIQDKEYRQLKSDFYSMQGEQDYLNLTGELNKIAEKNNIELRKKR